MGWRKWNQRKLPRFFHRSCKRSLAFRTHTRLSSSLNHKPIRQEFFQVLYIFIIKVTFFINTWLTEFPSRIKPRPGSSLWPICLSCHIISPSSIIYIVLFYVIYQGKSSSTSEVSSSPKDPGCCEKFESEPAALGPCDEVFLLSINLTSEALTSKETLV